MENKNFEIERKVFETINHEELLDRDEIFVKDNFPLDYSNKVVLAPMVRVGKLPFRLIALEEGADIVYTEELIAYKLQTCKRELNSKSLFFFLFFIFLFFFYKLERLNLIEYIAPNGEKVFQTCKKESPLVLQIGASDSVVALKAASLV